MPLTEQRAPITSQQRATLDYLTRAAEYAPRHAPCAPGLRGLWTADGWYVCADHGARIVARGCALPPGHVLVWQDKDEPFGVCCLCTPQEG